MRQGRVLLQTQPVARADDGAKMRRRSFQGILAGSAPGRTGNLAGTVPRGELRLGRNADKVARSARMNKVGHQQPAVMERRILDDTQNGPSRLRRRSAHDEGKILGTCNRQRQTQHDQRACHSGENIPWPSLSPSILHLLPSIY